MKNFFQKNASKRSSFKVTASSEGRNRVEYAAKAVALNVLFLLISLSPAAAQSGNVGGSMKQLFEQQIQPVLDAIILIAVAIAAVYCGIMFFQGKREALKQLGMVIAGALVIKFLSMVVAGIIK